MHEMSLIMSLIDEVEKLARKENATRVRSVTLSVGEWSGVEMESFRFCFPLATEGTLLEGASLIVNDIPVVVLCKNCATQARPEVPMINCSKCHSRDVSLVQGREFSITAMEID